METHVYTFLTLTLGTGTRKILGSRHCLPMCCSYLVIVYKAGLAQNRYRNGYEEKSIFLYCVSSSGKSSKYYPDKCLEEREKHPEEGSRLTRLKLETDTHRTGLCRFS